MIFKPLRIRPRVIALCWLIMLGSVVIGVSLRPHKYWADFRGEPQYEQLIPHQFGDWQELAYANRSVVNPVMEEGLKRLYSQTLARTYVNRKTGRAVMLSIAYGRDQTNDTQLHTPEQCYPAQGFRIVERDDHDIPTSFGRIKAVRVLTYLGIDRREPVTFFVRVGDHVARGSGDRNMERIRMAMQGYLVDGTLIRVSEITRRDDSFAVQDRFLNDLLNNLPPNSRRYLIGESGI